VSLTEGQEEPLSTIVEIPTVDDCESKEPPPEVTKRKKSEPSETVAKESTIVTMGLQPPTVTPSPRITPKKVVGGKWL